MELGVVIACSGQSLRFARGCCASIRYFLGDAPICLIVDGKLPLHDLVETYGALVLDRHTVVDPALRTRSFGWGLTKMIALWESPWEAFLCLDPDTVVWGDVLGLADLDRYDVVLDQQFARNAQGLPVNPLLYDLLGQPKPDAALRRSVVERCLFDLDRLEQHFPDFDWRQHLHGFSWTGAFFARRGIFALEDYLELLDLTERHPGLFLGGEMGLLNFMIFRAAGRGALRVANQPLQVLVCEEEPDALRRRFAVRRVAKGNGNAASGLITGQAVREPVVRAGDAAVIHWTGPKKPTPWSRHLPAPMTYMRRRCLRETRGLVGLRALLALLWEEAVGAAHYARRKLRLATARIAGHGTRLARQPSAPAPTAARD